MATNFNQVNEENTVLGNNYQQQYSNQPPQGMPYGQPQYQSEPRKSNSGLIIGILVGLTVALVAFIGFYLYNNSQKNAEEAERLRIAQREDSIARVKAEKKAEAEAEARKLAEEETARIAAEQEARERAAEEAARYATASGTYSGKIAGSKVTMRLTQSGESLYGEDRWGSSSQWLDVSGSIYGSSVYLSEYNGDMQTGYIEGNIQGKYFTGNFTNYKGSTYSFTLSR